MKRYMKLLTAAIVLVIALMMPVHVYAESPAENLAERTVLVLNENTDALKTVIYEAETEEAEKPSIAKRILTIAPYFIIAIAAGLLLGYSKGISGKKK